MRMRVLALAILLLPVIALAGGFDGTDAVGAAPAIKYSPIDVEAAVYLGNAVLVTTVSFRSDGARFIYDDRIQTLLKTLNFRSGSAVIDSSYYPALDSVAALLKLYDSPHYEVQGHTDHHGNQRSNLLLSAARAGAVKDYMVSKGIAEESITAVGYGISLPIASMWTAEGRARNRRVDITLQRGAVIARLKPEPKPPAEKADEPEFESHEEPEEDAVVTRPRPRRFRYGLRVAYNNSHLPDMSVREYVFDGYSMGYEDYRSRFGAGHGFEVQAVALVRVTEYVAAGFYPGIARRSQFTTKAAVITEYAMTLPLTLEVNLAGGHLHIFCGAQADIPLNTGIKWSNGETFEPQSRAAADAGVVAGMSVYITENFFVDTRGIYGLTDFAGENTGSLYQFSVGLGWLW